MTSKEIHEQITAFVGTRVDEQEYRSKAQQNITPCPDCRSAYELELPAKLVIRERAQPPDVPGLLGATEAGGPESVAGNGTSAPAPVPAAESNEGWLDRMSDFFTAPLGIIVALVLVVLGVFAIMRATDRGEGKIIVEGAGAPASDSSRAAPAPSGPENFFNKAANNFSAILDGTLAIQHITTDQADLAKYFKDNGVAYDVTFAPVRAPLAGGVISQHGNTRLAHVIYSHGEASVYLFEVPRDVLRKGDIVYVTPDVLQQLDEGKTFWQEPNGHNLAVFRMGEVICAVVSNLSKQEMGQIVAAK